jgi:tRNA-Thr(GGU) m(6)t(6)A37 methyltransferase TsaA
VKEVLSTFDDAREAVTFTPIGYVENDWDAPAMPETIAAAESRIVIDPDYVDGLTGLEPGHRLMVVFHFHLVQTYELLQHPRGDPARPKRGLFCLHTPHRPNPIGITTVDVVGVEANVLSVRGLDALNSSPVLDLKRV